MKGRAAAWVAWALAALTVLLMALHLTWWTLAEPVEGAQDTRAEVGPIIPFVVVGALIVTRRPDNRIGWLFCLLGFFLEAASALDAYALYALAARPDAGLPVATAAAWVASWGWTLGLTLLLLLLLLYPTGRLPSPRWHPVAWLVGLMALVTIAASAFQPGPLKASEVPLVTNPLGIDAAGGILDLFNRVGSALIYLLAAAGVASVVLRFRRARGVERQQLKWFVYATVGVVIGSVLGEAILGLMPNPSQMAVDLIFTVPIIGWPVALGIAVLRYRLYEIDRLINRTLVYGLLTVLLGVSYAACVVVLGQLFGQDRSSLAVAGATLAAAALVQPARRRIQQLVDRRFNRRRYDATRAVEAFSARLRNELDLDTLSGELMAVVNETVRPSTASLWLRPPAQTTPSGEGLRS